MSQFLHAQNSGAIAAALTITLHWWMLPAVLLALAALCWWKAEHADGGCFSGIGEMFAAIALFLLAMAVCVGHWL